MQSAVSYVVLSEQCKGQLVKERNVWVKYMFQDL